MSNVLGKPTINYSLIRRQEYSYMISAFFPCENRHTWKDKLSSDVSLERME